MLPKALKCTLLVGPGSHRTGAFADPFGAGKMAGSGLEHVTPDNPAALI